MRRILNTSRGCPITQLYLELGQFPARFQIQKMRLLYLKYIMEQSDESLLKKFLNLQLKNPTRGDWASTCMKNIQELEITLSLEDIETMTKYKFSKMLKTKIHENALKYLEKRRGEKGEEIVYECLEMSEYLQPTNKLDIIGKQELFEVRNRMTQIPDNFPKSKEENKCFCGEKENMIHIYNCDILNENLKPNVKYENIFNGNIEKQKEVFKRFKQNLEKRKNILSETRPHEIQTGSTDISNVISNG